MKEGRQSLLLCLRVFFEIGKQQIAQSLRRRDFVPLPGGIELRIVIAPAVVFFLRDIACFQLGGNLVPCGKHPVKLIGIASFSEIDPKMNLVITLTDLKPVPVFQSEQWRWMRRTT